MSGYFTSAGWYGTLATVKSAQCPAGRSARCYIQPIDGRDTDDLRRPEGPGRINDERYALIAGPAALIDGETGVTVAAGGRVYELLRAEPVRVRGSVGHWEGTLRLKGGDGNG